MNDIFKNLQYFKHLYSNEKCVNKLKKKHRNEIFILKIINLYPQTPQDTAIEMCFATSSTTAGSKPKGTSSDAKYK